MPRKKDARQSNVVAAMVNGTGTKVVPVEMTSSTNYSLAIMAGLAVLCLLVYFRVFTFDFVLIDDDVYVSENPFIAGGLSFANTLWAWTSVHSSNWHPLTWMSHALDISLFGLNAGGHHAVNLALHIANSALVFLVVRNLTGAIWKSAIVAAIFALHPVHVESVAWISERKDVLSTVFWLTSTLLYIGYVKKPERTNYFWASVVLFGLGLASKPMLVTMPFTLLLLDYWALERFEKWNVSSLLPLIKEKLPYFVLSILSVLVTIFAQGTGGAIQGIQRFDMADRLANAVTAYVTYAAMLFYPVNLGAWYPFERDLPVAGVITAVLVLAAVTGLCIWQIRSHKYLFVGWFWFVGTLVPVIGIVQVGRQSMADRYTYIPYIGLTIAVVWLIADLVAKLKIDQRITAAFAAIIIAVFGVLSFRQVSYWQNSETLFQHTLSVTNNNYFIEHNYCFYLQKNNRLGEAENYCKAAIEHDPELAGAHNTLGTIKLKQKKFAEAKSGFEQAIQLKPAYPQAYANLALAAAGENDFAAAVNYISKGVEIDDQGFFDGQRLVDLYSNIGNGAMQQKMYPIAASAYEKALSAQPNNPELSRNLALAMHQSGRTSEAIEILEKVVRVGSGSAELHNSLGLMYAQTNRIEEAKVQFRRSLQINPNFAPAQNNLRQASGQ